MRKVLPYALNFFFVNQRGFSEKKKKTRGQTSYLSDCTCISRLQLATKASSILLHSTPKVTHHGPTEWKQKRPLVCTSRSMFYVMWNAWKERKRRTFNETTLTIVLDVAYLLKGRHWSKTVSSHTGHEVHVFVFVSSFFSCLHVNILVLLFSMSLCWNGQSTRLPRKFGMILVNSNTLGFKNYEFK